MLSGQYHIYAVEFLLRAFAGILFLFQGYDKLFRVKMPAVTDTFMGDASRYHIPRYMVSTMAWLTSITEFAGGICLLSGIWVLPCLYLLGADLLLVCLVFSFIEPMWDMKYVFPRLVLIAASFLLYREDYWGIVQLFK